MIQFKQEKKKETIKEFIGVHHILCLKLSFTWKLFYSEFMCWKIKTNTKTSHVSLKFEIERIESWISNPFFLENKQWCFLIVVYFLLKLWQGNWKHNQSIYIFIILQPISIKQLRLIVCLLCKYLPK